MATKKSPGVELSKRERQILDVLYELGTASAADIHAAISNPPTYTAVRTHLTNLEEKGQVKFEREGAKYIYQPIVPKGEMAKSLMDGLVKTFFENNVELVVASLIDPKQSQLSQEQLDRLAEIIEQARQREL
jgi:predicted transcriptional regulator